MPKITEKFEWDHPIQGRQTGHFRQITRCNSKTEQDRRIVYIKVEY